jgi:hypothetical protein
MKEQIRQGNAELERKVAIRTVDLAASNRRIIQAGCYSISTNTPSPGGSVK